MENSTKMNIIPVEYGPHEMDQEIRDLFKFVAKVRVEQFPIFKKLVFAITLKI